MHINKFCQRSGTQLSEHADDGMHCTLHTAAHPLRRRVRQTQNFRPVLREKPQRSAYTCQRLYVLPLRPAQRLAQQRCSTTAAVRKTLVCLCCYNICCDSLAYLSCSWSTRLAKLDAVAPRRSLLEHPTANAAGSSWRRSIGYVWVASCSLVPPSTPTEQTNNCASVFVCIIIPS